MVSMLVRDADGTGAGKDVGPAAATACRQLQSGEPCLQLGGASAQQSASRQHHTGTAHPPRAMDFGMLAG